MRHKKWTPYCRLPRRKQRDRFIQLHWKIRQDTGIYGGQFTSDHVLDEPGRPALFNQWADAYFVGSDGQTIWNATIITAFREFWDVAEEMAHTRAWEMLTPEEQAEETEFHFDPVWHKGQKMFQLREKPRQEYEKFGGLTYREFQDKLVEEIIRNEPPEICESFITDRSYRYGIGLTMVIHVDEINRHTIEEAIRRFRDREETDWRAAEPVLRDELPMECAKVAYSRIRWEPERS